MYKLYGKKADVWKLIDLSVDKKEIINDMVDISNRHNFYNYKVEDTNLEMIDYVSNPSELKEFLNKFKTQVKPLEDISCIELKRYILDKNKK